MSGQYNGKGKTSMNKRYAQKHYNHFIKIKSLSKIDFNKPIPAGTIIELSGFVIHLGNTSLKVQVDIFVEEMYSDSRLKAVTGVFSFVAIGKDKKPTPII